MEDKTVEDFLKSKELEEYVDNLTDLVEPDMPSSSQEEERDTVPAGERGLTHMGEYSNSEDEVQQDAPEEEEHHDLGEDQDGVMNQIVNDYLGHSDPRMMKLSRKMRQSLKSKLKRTNLSSEFP